MARRHCRRDRGRDRGIFRKLTEKKREKTSVIWKKNIDFFDVSHYNMYRWDRRRIRLRRLRRGEDAGECLSYVSADEDDGRRIPFLSYAFCACPVREKESSLLLLCFSRPVSRGRRHGRRILIKQRGML